MVEFAAHELQTRFDVAQALAVGELRKGHGQILIPTRQSPMIAVAVVAGHALLKLDVRKVGDQLSKNGPAYVHASLFRRRRHEDASADHARLEKDLESVNTPPPNRRWLRLRLEAGFIGRAADWLFQHYSACLSDDGVPRMHAET